MSLYIEIAASTLGVIQGILVMLNKRCNWLFHSLQMILLLLFSYMEKLYGDMIYDIIFLIVGVIGYVLWNKKIHKKISRSNSVEVYVYTIITLILTCFLYSWLTYTHDPLPLLDAVSSSTSFLATILMSMRRLDCWIVWLVNDLLYCVEYYMLPNQALYLFALNALWSIMAIVSYFQWKQYLRQQEDFK